MRKLYRSRKDRILAGICGGLGDYFEIDPVLVRIVFVLVAFTRGFGILLYIILAVIIPLQSREGLDIKIEENIKDFTEKAGLSAQSLADELSKEAQSIAIEFKQNENWWKEKKNLFGIIVIIIGFISLLNQIFPSYWLKRETVFSLVAILIGIFIISKNLKDKSFYGK